jgi:hypothetical protein
MARRFYTPSFVSRGTESSKTPLEILSWRRVAILARAVEDEPAVSSSELHSDAFWRIEIVCLKSGGVTSETNHGRAFGLEAGRRSGCGQEREEGLNWKMTFFTPMNETKNSARIKSV